MNDEIGRGFAKRLQKLMDDKGWNQSVLARRAAIHMPNGKLDRQLIHNYLGGTTVPQHERLEAIAKALGVEPGDLVTAEDLPGMEARHAARIRAEAKAPRAASNVVPMAPTVSTVNVNEGGESVHLKIDRQVPFDVALEIMALLKQAPAH